MEMQTRVKSAVHTHTPEWLKCKDRIFHFSKDAEPLEFSHVYFIRFCSYSSQKPFVAAVYGFMIIGNVLSFFLFTTIPTAYGGSQLGVELELQLPGYATATVTPDLSPTCNPHHSSQQRQDC